MKILYFFDFSEINLNKVFRFLKRTEINNVTSYIKKKYKDHFPSIKYYCLNNSDTFLSTIPFEYPCKTIRNEYFNISRADYKKILRKSWDINIELFNNLLKSNLPKLN
ncbi:MAG: hypothetical protein ACTSVK_00215, partial [Promethearchaeota archaeon]